MHSFQGTKITPIATLQAITYGTELNTIEGNGARVMGGAYRLLFQNK